MDGNKGVCETDLAGTLTRLSSCCQEMWKSGKSYDMVNMVIACKKQKKELWDDSSFTEPESRVCSHHAEPGMDKMLPKSQVCTCYLRK